MPWDSHQVEQDLCTTGKALQQGVARRAQTQDHYRCEDKSTIPSAIFLQALPWNMVASLHPVLMDVSTTYIQLHYFAASRTIGL